MLLLFFRRRVFLGVNGTDWMDVEDVWVDSSNSIRMVDVDTDIKEQRQDGQLVGDEDGLGLAEQLVTHGQV